MTDATENFAAKCRQAGLRVTPQRMAVYEALAATTAHPTAEAIFKTVRRSMPHISLDTVNRTLLTFRDVGLAITVEGSGGARRFDADMTAHQHFRCIKCDRVIDFHHKPFDEIKVPRSLSKKFKVLKKTVYLEGICKACQG